MLMKRKKNHIIIPFILLSLLLTLSSAAYSMAEEEIEDQKRSPSSSTSEVLSEDGSQDKGYFLKVGQDGAERLEVLNELINPVSQRFLQKIGLRDDMTILELGPGTGHMAVWFAEQVPNGKVIAVDNSPEQLEIVRSLARAKDIHNIQLIQASAYDLDTLEYQNEIDLIFSRFVFNHLVTPQDVLLSLKKLLKPGATMVIHDMIARDSLHYPENAVIKEWLDLLFKCYAHYKKDPDIGLKLVSLFKEAGLSITDYDYHQPLLKTSHEKLQIKRGVVESRQDLLDQAMISEETLDTLIHRLGQLSLDDSLVLSFPANMIVAGKKEGH
ncbi:MAG: methyltransferase domain-containing protein [Alphaproteobacteria bacterium]|nr:methyltransferase domain-containing protein [Alphaproteobacteria bacterium]MBP9776338.1 methyltransferase domain-containing protein [Alphaproteobacteria bacterium]